MAGPQRSVQVVAKPKKAAKSEKMAGESEKPFRLMDLNNHILKKIIRVVGYPARAGSLRSREWGLEDRKNLSLVNKRLRELSTQSLFKYSRFHETYYPRDERISLMEKLEMLVKQPSILKAIQYLTVEAAIFETAHHYNTPDVLLKSLGLMPNLKEISLRLRGSEQLLPLLESHLTYKQKLPILDTVQSISIYTMPLRERQANKFLKLTPNVEHASIDVGCYIRRCAQLQALSKLPKLRYLMLRRMVPRVRNDGEVPLGWGVDDIRAIAEIVPDINHLALVGQLHDGENDEARISDYIEPFGMFKKLERLDMTDEFVVPDDALQALYDPDDPIPYSGYWQETAERLAHKHRFNEKRPVVARKFFDTCPTLRQVFLTRCDERGELYERGERLAVKMTQKAPSKYWPEHDIPREFAFGFPRVLKVNALPGFPDDGEYYGDE